MWLVSSTTKALFSAFHYRPLLFDSGFEKGPREQAENTAPASHDAGRAPAPDVTARGTKTPDDIRCLSAPKRGRPFGSLGTAGSLGPQRHSEGFGKGHTHHITRMRDQQPVLRQPVLSPCADHGSHPRQAPPGPAPQPQTRRRRGYGTRQIQSVCHSPGTWLWPGTGLLGSHPAPSLLHAELLCSKPHDGQQVWGRHRLDKVTTS